MYKDNKILEIYKNSNIRVKLLIIFLSIIFFILLFFLSAYFVGSVLYAFNKSYSNKIVLGLMNGLVFTIIVWIILSAMIIISVFRLGNTQNTIVNSDDRGVYYMENATRGSAHFATEEEKDKYFDICDIEETDEFTFGQETDDGERVVAYKPKTSGAPGTRHILIVAPSGLGKTYTIGLTNALQAKERGHSVLFVDPSTEVYNQTGQMFRKDGYDTRLLNLANLDYSEFWDCLQETIDDKTERIDSERLQSFALIFAKNSAKGDDEDYWFGCAVNLIETVIGYAAWLRETKILNDYILLYERITQKKESDKYKNILKDEFISLPLAERKLLEAAEKYNQDIDDIKQTIKNIKKIAPQFNIGVVYDMILDFNTHEKEFSKMPKHHPGHAAFKRYSQQTKDSVRAGAIQGAQMKFKIFDNPKLRKVLSSEGINFNTINKRRSAYYLAIPDNDTLYTPIASLFFSFFYRDAQRNYDHERDLAQFENRPNRCIPVMCLMDEFSSLGTLTGDEKMFGTVMSDARKRKIYNVIIIQYYSQLESNYGKYVRDGIVSNCSTLVCLGANDPNTKEFVSEACGVASVMNETHRELNTIFGNKVEDNSMSVSTVERRLITPDEIGNLMDKVLVKRHGAGPIIINPFPWTQHQLYINGECPTVTYFENITCLAEDPFKEKQKEEKDEEEELRKKIMSYNSYTTEDGIIVDKETGDILYSPNSEKKEVKRYQQPEDKEEKKKKKKKKELVKKTSDSLLED